MGLLPPAGVGLIGSLSLHTVLRNQVRREPARGIGDESRDLRVEELSILVTAVGVVKQPPDVCATFAPSRTSYRTPAWVRFGSFPKISTTVENTVEKRVLNRGTAKEPMFFASFAEAKLNGSRVFGIFRGLVLETAALKRRFKRRKSGSPLFY